MALVLREADVNELLTVDMAVDAVRRIFALMSSGGALNYPRQRGGPEGSVLNVMWAVSPELGLMGCKTYPVVRTDVTQGSTSTLVLYGLPDGQLQGVMEANVLGQRRTGAASAVACEVMARRDSESLAVFGAGRQAEAQVLAISRVLPRLRRVLVVGRSPERTRRFVDMLATSVDLPVLQVTAEGALSEADVVVTATGSAEPVFSGEWLRPGTHVNAIGSNYASKRELDQTAIDKADMVAVDSLEVAKIECGDLLANDFDWTRLREVSDLVSGHNSGRESDQQITLFESQGLAVQDLACGAELLHGARKHGIGVEFRMGLPSD